VELSGVWQPGDGNKENKPIQVMTSAAQDEKKILRHRGELQQHCSLGESHPRRVTAGVEKGADVSKAR
jgi:hypothetical protein